MTTIARTHPPLPSTPATVRQRHTYGQHPTGHRVTVTEAFAREIGRSEAWAHKALYHFPKLEDLAVASIRARRLAGDDMGLARFRLVVQREFANQAGQALTATLQKDAQVKDGAEDATATALACDKCLDTARAEQRALRAEIDIKTKLLEAIDAEFGPCP